MKIISSFYFHNKLHNDNIISNELKITAVINNIIHWITVVTTKDAVTEGLGLSIWDLTEYFYSNNGLVVLNHQERLQREFDALKDLFGWVGLRKNMKKTAIMDCQP